MLEDENEMLELFCTEMIRHYSNTFRAFETELRHRSSCQEIGLSFEMVQDLLKNVESSGREVNKQPGPALKLIEHMFENQEKLFARIGEVEATIIKRAADVIPGEFRKTVQRLE